MKKEKTDKRKKIGLPPGSLIYVGKNLKEKVTIEAFIYDEESYIETEIKKIDEIKSLKENKKTMWLNINGVHDIKIIEKIGEIFNLHPLLLEDVLNTTQKPKLDEYDEYIFLCCQMLSLDNEYNIIEEHISFVIGKNYVISFQERKGDVFDPIRDRIRFNKGKIKKMKADYLAYCLLDVLIDNYYLITEKISDKIENVEDVIINETKEDLITDIYKIKKDVIIIRKYIWPLRTIIAKLRKNENGIINKSINIFLKDIYDHTVEILETIEIFREILSGLLEINLSAISYKMNSIMKVLTIISTIFIPLTFIAGVYGMNFENMPELKWKYGYFAALGLMLLVALIMIKYFRKNKWI
ncbi:MAG TPA: magnesium/cobalt transporter CorA [Spirochaetota bacterium]|nr:magnesium/cobalt transporter CorA [Spirochaetota bacterium]HOM37598.1 magnesium/cobalt transporter CorA [Spirochaetota bacterium]HPQ49431.1 magnesium/cobalt transporter CorA [Spirochaetota bacterium]